MELPVPIQQLGEARSPPFALQGGFRIREGDQCGVGRFAVAGQNVGIFPVVAALPGGTGVRIHRMLSCLNRLLAALSRA